MTGQQVSPYRIGGTIHSMSQEQARGLAIDARAAHHKRSSPSGSMQSPTRRLLVAARAEAAELGAAGTDERSRR
jgi:hypothetical protein